MFYEKLVTITQKIMRLSSMSPKILTTESSKVGYLLPPIGGKAVWPIRYLSFELLIVGDICSIQSTLLGCKTNSFFRRDFGYSFLTIPCIQATLKFVLPEIEFHFETK